MKPDFKALEKWRDRLRIDRQRTERALMESWPRGFIKYYFGMIKFAIPVIRTAGFATLMYYLVVWPIKFFIYLKRRKGILLPFSIKK
jgi:hypothetical protein